MTTAQQTIIKAAMSEMRPEERATFDASCTELRAALAPYMEDTEGPRLLALAMVMSEVGEKLGGK